jgi:hypothetical protein
MRPQLMASTALLTVLLAGSAGPTEARPAQAQTQAPPPAAADKPQTAASQVTTPATAAAMPVDLDKIKNIVNQSPKATLNLDSMRARFYVQVNAEQKPLFSSFVGTFDLRNGPVPRAGMTHQEFLNLVTPKELYSAAGIQPKEVLQFAITNYLAQALVRKALEEIKSARNESEIQAIRERINRELAALMGK